MITSLIFTIMFIIYMIPGLFVSRALYASRVREISAKPVTVVPPKPKRPEVELSEMLHVSSPNSQRCQRLDYRGSACTCQYRDEWIKVKNAWIDYDEWMHEYSHIKNGVVAIPEAKVNLLTVPFWPLILTSQFIQGGAKNIIKPGEIEALERHAYDNPFKELE